MFYLFARSLVERELSIKLNNTPASFDIRTLKLKQSKIGKIAKVYFENIAHGPELGLSPVSADNLSQHFVSSLVRGAIETEEEAGELYNKKDQSIQVTFFLIKLLREF